MRIQNEIIVHKHLFILNSTILTIIVFKKYGYLYYFLFYFIVIIYIFSFYHTIMLNFTVPIIIAFNNQSSYCAKLIKTIRYFNSTKMSSYVCNRLQVQFIIYTFLF